MFKKILNKAVKEEKLLNESACVYAPYLLFMVTPT